jgi:thioredoxin 1
MHLCAQNRRSRSMNPSAQSYRCPSIRLYPDQPVLTYMNKQASNEKVIPINETDFDSTVLQSEVPVFVDFYADWCGPCNMIAPTIEALSEEYAGKVKFVKINVDNNQQLAVKYDILSIPTSMLFESGTVKDSIIGAYPASAYRQRIDHALGPSRSETSTPTVRR